VPLEKQSSRMFHFVFMMFTVGAAALPKWGMQGYESLRKVFEISALDDP
jgi:hypothetical protein